MPAKLDLLTPTEAAVVAGVTVRDVHRIIDTRVLPERFYAWKGGRRLRSSGCTSSHIFFLSTCPCKSEAKGRRWVSRAASAECTQASPCW